jgi:hypothetical protein
MKRGAMSTLTPVSPASMPERVSDTLLWIAVLLILIPQLVRATTGMTTFPGWDLDPLIYAVTGNSITPAGSLLIDALSLLGAALLLVWSARRGIAFHLPLILLTLIGAAGVVLHGWIVGPNHGSLGNQRIGASWLGAMLAALAIWHAAQDLRVRRVLAGTLLGLIALLALHGVVQVCYVHAQTVADFNANPNKLYASHGWLPDSSMAKSFKRRLEQPEASGWFGLANVYATFAAAGLVAGAGLLWGRIARRSPLNAAGQSPLFTLLLGLFTIASAIALFLAHAKGGFASAVGGLVALPILAILRGLARFGVRAQALRASGGCGIPPLARRARCRILQTRLGRLAALYPAQTRVFAGFLGLSAIAAPIALVLIRGRLGEHFASGEHSLLFRSFYARAAGSIFLEHPILGVGPDGFQRAFTLAKPPLCPEEVTSPHCIVWDWLATLGILGLAWICILARWAVHAATNAIGSFSSTSGTSSPPISRSDLRGLLFLPAAATVLAAFVESPYIAPESALVRIVGLALWCAAGWAIAANISNAAGSRVALAAAALALLAHAQIDVTASFVASSPLWAMLIAAIAAPAGLPLPPTAAPGTRRRIPITACTLAILPPLGLCILLLATTLTRTRVWELYLTRSAESVRPIAEFTDRLASLSTPHVPGQPPAEDLGRIVRDLARTIGHDVQPTQSSVENARMELARQLLPAAAAELERAYSVYPDDRRPLREASRLHLQLAEIAHAEAKPEAARDELARAVRTVRLLPPPAAPNQDEAIVPDPSSSDWHWLAVILERRADMLGEPESRVRAAEARLSVAKLDPYNLENALRLWRDYQKLNDAPQARLWAVKALELHEYTRLDRETRGLSPGDFAEIQKTAQP